MIGQTLHRKLKIEQHKPTKMHGMILCVPEVSKRPGEKWQKKTKKTKQTIVIYRQHKTPKIEQHKSH